MRTTFRLKPIRITWPIAAPASAGRPGDWELAGPGSPSPVGVSGTVKPGDLEIALPPPLCPVSART